MIGVWLRRLFARVPKKPAPIKKQIIPAAWLDDTPMKRIVLHWTAGSNRAGLGDLEHYHICVDGHASLYKGVDIAANSLKRLRDDYARHVRKMNTGTIGVAVCGMAGAKERPFDPGKYPINEAQFNSACRVVGELARHYGIKIGPKTVLMHAEVQANLGIPQRGKWDIAVFPWAPGKFNTAKACGDYMREKARQHVHQR